MLDEGNAYNVADSRQNISLRELAETIAKIKDCHVVFDVPDQDEAKGASTFQNVRLSSTKIEALGWKAVVTMEDGVRHTIKYLEKRQLRNGITSTP